MKIKFFSILCALCLVGCVGQPSSTINRVALGMSKDQVLKVMGSPTSITADQNAEYLNYSLREHPNIFQPCQIKIVNGKVESYGLAGSPTAAPQPMPVIIPMMH